MVYTLLSLAIIYSLDFLSKFIFGNVIGQYLQSIDSVGIMVYYRCAK